MKTNKSDDLKYYHCSASCGDMTRGWNGWAQSEDDAVEHCRQHFAEAWNVNEEEVDVGCEGHE